MFNIDELRLIMHCKAIPDGNFDIQNNFLSVIVIEIPFIEFYSPTFTPLS